MTPKVESILQRISDINPRHAKKIQHNLQGLGTDYFDRAESFYNQYEAFALKLGKDLEYGIQSYMQMIADYIYEQVRFAQTGVYSCQSFADAEERVYNNPEVMEYYMHGLMMSQFLWRHHYEIFEFFTQSLFQYGTGVNRYLEIGGGHGIYLAEAMDILGTETRYDLVDISASSIEIAKNFLAGRDVHYFHQDIYDYWADTGYDFITMGEVLEHVEDPISLLRQLGRLLAPKGTAFITAPANAPAIDHIYLFKNAQDIRNIIRLAGFTIQKEFSMYAENVSPAEAERKKVALMYGAFIQKNKSN